MYIYVCRLFINPEIYWTEDLTIRKILIELFYLTDYVLKKRKTILQDRTIIPIGGTRTF